MEKAYDLKVLGDKLKAQGLDVAEDVLAKALDEVFAWFKESAALSASPYDDMALIVLPQLEKIIKEQIDKIDGEED
jgi:hypothetical protein